MTNTEFQAYARDLVEKCFDVMGKANQEYASEEGRFDNFEGIAEFMRRFNPRLRDITASDIGWIYGLKHMISMIKNVSIRENMEGRKMDAINYLLLISGMMTENEPSDNGYVSPSNEADSGPVFRIGDILISGEDFNELFCRQPIVY